ncbi:hypothetical protein PDIDSM_8744 [Penicillium digitatum]|nr:hypothetical protein PDIDSM_8744 [Penicillium digitatum]
MDESMDGFGEHSHMMSSYAAERSDYHLDNPGSGINSHVGATAGTPAPQTNRLDTKRTQNMGTSSTSTVHAVELRGLVLALQIILDTPPTSVPPNKRAVIFTDNQAASKPSETPSIRPASTSWSKRYKRLDEPKAKDGSEQELEAYERLAVEKHVYHIIAELCKIPAACEEFGLGHGIRLSNHTNSLTENTAIETDTSQPSSTYHPRPDQIYIHRADGITETILTTVEYKPPHKLPVAALRTGLRPMNLWNDLVRSNKIPTNQEAKLRYNAARLSCSALVQEYHVMIQEGLEFSYVTNGIARVLLRVPYDNPSTLEYFLCDPNSEIISEDGDFFQQPRTSVARTLCLCLMAFRSPIRDQEWRNSVRPRLRTWETSFNHARSQLSNTELEQIAIHSDSTTMDFPSPESGSSYALPSSSPDSPTTDGRRVPTRSYATVHLLMSNTAPSRRSYLTPIRTTQREGSADSVKSCPHRLPDKLQVVPNPVNISAISHSATMRSFAHSSACLGCRLEAFWMTVAQM